MEWSILWQGPGLFFIMPCIDTYKKVDLRTVSFDVPPQEVREGNSLIYRN
jgi:erythrocyte band 7 integral membrane protein